MVRLRRIGFMVAGLGLGLAGLAHAGLPQAAPAAPAAPLTLKLAPIQIAQKVVKLRAQPGSAPRPAAATGTSKLRGPAEAGAVPIKVPPALTSTQRAAVLQSRGFELALPPDDSPDNVTLTPRQPYLQGAGINLLSVFNTSAGLVTMEPSPTWPYGPVIFTSYYAILTIEARAGSKYVIDFGLTTWECLKSSSCAAHLETYELLTNDSTVSTKVAASPDMHVLAVVEVDGDGVVEVLLGRMGTSPSKDADVLIRSVNVSRVGASP